MLVLRLTDFGFELLAFFQQEKQHLILDFDRFHQQRMPVGPQSGMVHLLEQLVLLQLLLALLGLAEETEAEGADDLQRSTANVKTRQNSSKFDFKYARNVQANGNKRTQRACSQPREGR